MKQTLYDVLGVSPDASFEDIQVAYDKRFAQLRVETSFDSNRLVLLSEAREVLSDPARRAAYDVSLATPSGPRQRVEAVDGDGHSGLPVKRIVAGALLIAIAIWWLMRDEAPTQQPAQNTSVPEQLRPTLADEDSTMTQGTRDETFEERPMTSSAVSTAAESAARDETAVEANSPVEASAVPAQAASETAVDSPIVGDWECFDPVTGRGSQYVFGSDGQMTMRQTGGGMQRFGYELTGTQIKLADTDPPQTMAIEELSESKLVLNTAGEGRRLVCAR